MRTTRNSLIAQTVMEERKSAFKKDGIVLTAIMNEKPPWYACHALRPACWQRYVATLRRNGVGNSARAIKHIGNARRFAGEGYRQGAPAS